MTSALATDIPYNAKRLTLTVDERPHVLRQRYENAVPPLPVSEIKALVARHAPWEEMRALILANAPLGLLKYDKKNSSSR